MTSFLHRLASLFSIKSQLELSDRFGFYTSKTIHPNDQVFRTFYWHGSEAILSALRPRFHSALILGSPAIRLLRLDITKKHHRLQKQLELDSIDPALIDHRMTIEEGLVDDFLE